MITVEAQRYWSLYARKLTGEITSAETGELEEYMKKEPGFSAQVDKIETFWRGQTLTRLANKNQLAELIRNSLSENRSPVG